MLKGEDPIVLLRLAGAGEDWTVRSLEADTGIPRSVIHRSIRRLGEAGLLDASGRGVNLGQVEEFLVHGAKYVFPPKLEGETRGFPTAWAASPLKEQMAPTAEMPPVWPHPAGRTRGIALQPLHPVAVEIAERDPALGGLLAIVDALRLGDARVREVAANLLRERFASGSVAR